MKRVTMLAAAAAALALLGAGCGGGGAEAEAASAEKTREDAMLAYARCMRENGFDMPDPQPGGGSLVRVNKSNQKKFEQASEACDHLMKDAVGEISEEDRQRMQDQALKFARCMREHGIDMPDPTFDGSGKMRQALRAPANKPKMRAAEEACREEGGPVFRSAPRP